MVLYAIVIDPVYRDIQNVAHPVQVVKDVDGLNRGPTAMGGLSDVLLGSGSHCCATQSGGTLQHHWFQALERWGCRFNRDRLTMGLRCGAMLCSALQGSAERCAAWRGLALNFECSTKE